MGDVNLTDAVAELTVIFTLPRVTIATASLLAFPGGVAAACHLLAIWPEKWTHGGT